MVTPASKGRFAFVCRSIADYCKQSHPEKELVIVLDQPGRDDLARLRLHVASLGRGDIRLMQVAEKRSLGALRNISVDRASGPLLCQWDDDDLYHETRLEYQVGALLGRKAGAVYLKNTLHLFPKTKEIYWLGWGETELRGHPVTLLLWKEHAIRYAESGDRAHRGEDADVLRQLCRETAVAFLDNPLYLYTYVFHGGNTWHYNHHRFAATRFSVDRALMKERRAELMQAINKADVRIDSLQIMDGGSVLWADEPIGGVSLHAFSLRRMLARTMSMGTRLVSSRKAIEN